MLRLVASWRLLRLVGAHQAAMLARGLWRGGRLNGAGRLLRRVNILHLYG